MTPRLNFRGFQLPIFADRTLGVVLLHWSRQIGKSFVLAAWAVDRLLTRPGRLVTVLSNSRDNGAEFVQKVAEVCRHLGAVFERMDDSPDATYENMRMEVRITVKGQTGRIKVLAANPRTARGFSGDLILDEFAFHEDSAAIWEAAEPILSSNADFLCRIASTGNGKHNMFYRMASGLGEPDARGLRTSATGFAVSRVTRTDAHRMGVKVYDPVTRQPITPEEARAKALDKRAYEQNYECAFADENMALLTHELISAAERSPVPVDSQSWSAASLVRMYRASGDLYVGNDIGRSRDLSVQWVLERVGNELRTIGVLRMSGVRLPAQCGELAKLCQLPKFRRYEGDMTGLGLGLVEFAQEQFGLHRIQGVNFSSSEPISDRLLADGRKATTAKVTELMATDLLEAFEDRRVDIPAEAEIRDDLRKPEKVTTPGGKVSIAATRDEAGHADHFWALALAVRAARTPGGALDAALLPQIHLGQGNGVRPFAPARFRPRRMQWA